MFVGIDVSKDWVDVAVRPTGETWRGDLDGGRPRRRRQSPPGA